jgi:hypothetical protein
MTSRRRAVCTHHGCRRDDLDQGGVMGPSNQPMRRRAPQRFAMRATIAIRDSHWIWRSSARLVLPPTTSSIEELLELAESYARGADRIRAESTQAVATIQELEALVAKLQAERASLQVHPARRRGRTTAHRPPSLTSSPWFLSLVRCVSTKSATRRRHMTSWFVYPTVAATGGKGPTPVTRREKGLPSSKATE